MNVTKFSSHDTMTLKEIADLLEIRHDHAMRMTDKLVDDQGFGHATQIEYRTSQGNECTTYSLNKRQSIAVASRLNVALLMRVVDRWKEVERVSAKRLPINYIDALKALVVSEEEKLLLQNKIDSDQQ